METRLTSMGNILGPSAGSTDNAVPRWDGTGGTSLQNSGVTIDDSNNMIIPGNLTVQGTTTSTVNQTISGTVIIDLDDVEALLVRKDADGGDIFTVDTTNSLIEMGGNVQMTDNTLLGSASSGGDLTLSSTSNATKGNIFFGGADGLNYDETNARLSIGGAAKTYVISGGAAIGSKLSTHTEGATDLAEVAIERHSDTAGFGSFAGMFRSRGSEASETVVQDNDVLGRLNFYGFDGTDYELAAEIYVEVDGTPADSATDMPGAIVFGTSAEGSSTPTEVMRIDSSQMILITGDLELTHTASSNDDHAMELIVDANGSGDVKALDIAYTTGAIVTGEDEAIILVNIDETAALGGEIYGLEVLTTDGAADAVYGMKAGAIVGPILQDSGVFINPTTATNNTASTDVPAMLDGSAGTNTTIFVNDDDYIIIGNVAAFTEIEFVIETPTTNPGITPTFEYSTSGTGQFTTFSPVDGTNGFRNTGVVAWDAADLTGHVADDVTLTFDIRITRTHSARGNVSLFYAKTAVTVVYSWDKNGVITSNTLEPTGDVTAGDAAAIGYLATDGLILTGQGSTFDVVIKNDTAADVLTVATGTTNVDVVGSLTAGSLISDAGLGLTGDITFAVGADRIISVATDNSAGDALTIVAGSGGSGDVAAGQLNLTGGAGGSGGANVGGDVLIAGGVDGGTSVGGNVRIRGGVGDTNGSIFLGDANTVGVTLGVDGTVFAMQMTEKSSIALDPAGGADGDYSGTTFTAVAGATIAFGETVYLLAGDSEWYLTDADATATAGVVAVAIAVSGGTDGGAVTLMQSGIIRADAVFPTFTIGAPVYLSATPGALTSTAPSGTDDVVRIVGHAITGNEILVNISPDFITVV